MKYMSILYIYVSVCVLKSTANYEWFKLPFLGQRVGLSNPSIALWHGYPK